MAVSLVVIVCSHMRGATPLALSETLVPSNDASHCMHPSALPKAQQELQTLYTSLLHGVNASAWPDTDSHRKLWRGLRRELNGRVEPVNFDADGPLQTAFFLRQSHLAMHLVADACTTVFEPFLKELRHGLSNASLRVVDQGIFRPDPNALHTVAVVFSEHPSLLDDADRAKWHHVTEAQLEILRSALREPVEAQCPLRLQLWGYAITADGSMVLLLAEAPNGSSLLELREEIQSIGNATLGELNSRPKKLVHVSLMRLLDWPFARLTAAEQRHVAKTVGRWSDALSKQQLPSGAKLPNLGVHFQLDELELVRDLQWMMTRRRTYATYDLDSSAQRHG